MKMLKISILVTDEFDPKRECDYESVDLYINPAHVACVYQPNRRESVIILTDGERIRARETADEIRAFLEGTDTGVNG